MKTPPPTPGAPGSQKHPKNGSFFGPPTVKRSILADFWPPTPLVNPAPMSPKRQKCVFLRSKVLKMAQKTGIFGGNFTLPMTFGSCKSRPDFKKHPKMAFLALFGPFFGVIFDPFFMTPF